ncbi:unnamed protein product [Arctogadus glacialis]
MMSESSSITTKQERSSFSPSASPQPNSTSSPVHAPAARPAGRMEEDPTRLPTHLLVQLLHGWPTVTGPGAVSPQ